MPDGTCLEESMIQVSVKNKPSRITEYDAKACEVVHGLAEVKSGSTISDDDENFGEYVQRMQSED